MRFVSSTHAALATRVLTLPLMGLPPIEHICLFWTYTEAPSLHRHYPASSVLRASPSPHTARPVSPQMPVDRIRDHRWGFPCCYWSTLPACRRHYPGRSDGTRSLVLSHQQRPPRLHGGLAPALIVSRPAQRSLTLRPACSPSHLSDPLHRRLRRFRFLHRRSDRFRVERTVPGRDFHPQSNSAFSRRTRYRNFVTIMRPV